MFARQPKTKISHSLQNNNKERSSTKLKIIIRIISSVFVLSYVIWFNSAYESIKKNTILDENSTYVKDSDSTSKHMEIDTSENEIHSADANESNQRLIKEELKDNLLHKIDRRPKVSDPDAFWRIFVKELASLKNPGIAMEVGMANLQQCLLAATAGLQIHCIEPSPKNFKICKMRFDKLLNMSVREKMHLHNFAAGSKSEGTVPFTSDGSTGDHVGTANMWLMESNNESAEKESANIVHVATRALDDFIADQFSPDAIIEVLKIDTQGYEPSVFSGLTRSLKQLRINYILFEFWPRGMDLLANKKDECVATTLLHELAKYGYTLYVFQVEAHPKAPSGWAREVNNRPLDNFEDFCRWYFTLETMFPDENYKMGYWSNILAVSPNVMDNPSMRTTGDVSNALFGK